MRLIHVLTTGGTIDKVYATAGHLEVGPPAAPDLVGPVLTEIEYDVRPVLAVDSLDMTDDHRALLLAAVEDLPGELVLVTHGTDTMPETARYLIERLSPAASGKTIVLTGAMRPASLRWSDASYNIGAASAAVQLLPPGVHIAMSGRIFAGDRVAKDTGKGVFVDLG